MSEGKMNERVGNVIALLQSFEPSEDETKNVRRLYEIFNGFTALPGGEAAIPAILGVMERYPEVELGSPGPLVHELEALPGYESFLCDSLRRQPAGLSIWMVNRIANAVDGAERDAWLAQLRAVLDHPRASASLKEDALRFLSYQAQRVQA
jgi:hypothetical protein